MLQGGSSLERTIRHPLKASTQSETWSWYAYFRSSSSALISACGSRDVCVEAPNRNLRNSSVHPYVGQDSLPDIEMHRAMLPLHSEKLRPGTWAKCAVKMCRAIEGKGKGLPHSTALRCLMCSTSMLHLGTLIAHYKARTRSA